MRPVRDCGEPEIVGALFAIVCIVGGIAFAVLSCRGWKW